LLPFLKNKQASVAGVIVKQREPDEKPESDQDDSSAGVESCAQELIRAIHAKDAKSVANAMRDLMEVIEASPEDESEEKHTYEAQNIKAAEDSE
jgi:hypothetical protein